MSEKIKLEVCVDTTESALIAQEAGAYRIELCSGLTEGGITPSPSLITVVRGLLKIKVYVIIRPRGGDFLYNDQEFEIIKSDVQFCGETGCDGVVVGILNQNGSIDKQRCKELVDIAKKFSMGVTFHRAIDRSNDLFEAMEDIIELGCERILTSGGYDTAWEGMEIIRQLIERAKDRIIIMPGSGINAENAEILIKRTAAKELHGTFKTKYPSKMQYKNTHLKHQNEEYTYTIADADQIRTVCNLKI